MSRAESCVHRLHPLAKMLAASGLIVMSLWLRQAAATAIVLVFFFGMLALARFRPRAGMLLFVLPAASVLAAGNYYASGSPLVAANYVMRLVAMFAAAAFMAGTTSPQALARSLARLRLPPGFVVAMILFWRFFPALVRDAREIREAGALRGEGHSAIFRGLLVPLVFSAFERTEQVALALELRAFDPSAKRTWFSVPRVRPGDAMFLAAAIMVGVTAALVEVGGPRPW